MLLQVDRTARRSNSPRDVVEIVAAAGQQKYLHQHGIIHRSALFDQFST